MATYRRRVDNRHSGLAWRVILPPCDPISNFTLTTSQYPITHLKRFGLLITRPLTRLTLSVDGEWSVLVGVLCWDGSGGGCLRTGDAVGMDELTS